MGRCKPKINLEEFSLEKTDFHKRLNKEIISLLHETKSYMIIPYPANELIEYWGLKKLDSFSLIYKNEFGEEKVCLDDKMTCYRLDIIRSLCGNFEDAYADYEQPLVIRISENWYLVLAPE